MTLPITRRLALALLCLILALSLGLSLWLFRLDLLTWAANRTLESQGLTPASFMIESANFHSIRASHVSLRDGAIKAEEMSISFSPRAILSGDLGKIEIGGFFVTGLMTDKGMVWGGQVASTGEGGTASPLAGLSLEALTVQDAFIEFDTGSWKIEALISGEFSLANMRLDGNKIAAAVTIKNDDTQYTASIPVETVSLLLPDKVSGELNFAHGLVIPTELPWVAKEIGGSLSWNKDGIRGTALINEVVNQQSPALIIPLGVEASGTLAGSQAAFSLTARTKGANDVSISAHGTHDLSSKAGSVKLDMKPVRFDPTGLQPGDLFPLFGMPVEKIRGSVGIDGGIAWNGTTLSPDISILLSSIGFDAPQAQIRDMQARIRLNNIWPPATPAGQKITARLMTSALPPADIAASGQLTKSSTLRLQTLAIGITGGTIAASPFMIDLELADIETTLTVEGLDFAQVMALLSIDGLTGTGRLDGQIPFTLQKNKFAIKGGKLSAREAGTVRYRPDSLPPELSSAHSSVDLMLRALTDFHYTKLDLDLDKKLSGEGTVLFKLQGMNPTSMPDQPFNFNISIESNFDKLADYIILSLSSTQELLKQAARMTRDSRTRRD